jgi:hypothetical protein
MIKLLKLIVENLYTLLIDVLQMIYFLEVIK